MSIPRCDWETLFSLDNPLLSKIALVLILVLWCIDALRKRKKNHSSDSVIEAANARERYEWRYFRWSFRAIQIAASLYILWVIVKYLLA